MVDQAKGIYGCKTCPKGTFSSDNSYGEGSCKPKRPCDIADVEFNYSKCVKGFRTETPRWATTGGQDGELGCNPEHEKSNLKKLPEKKKVKCKSCKLGEGRDSHGNCSTCNEGYYQPEDFSNHILALQDQTTTKAVDSKVVHC